MSEKILAKLKAMQSAPEAPITPAAKLKAARKLAANGDDSMLLALMQNSSPSARQIGAVSAEPQGALAAALNTRPPQLKSSALPANVGSLAAMGAVPVKVVKIETGTGRIVGDAGDASPVTMSDLFDNAVMLVASPPAGALTNLTGAAQCALPVTSIDGETGAPNGPSTMNTDTFMAGSVWIGMNGTVQDDGGNQAIASIGNGVGLSNVDGTQFAGGCTVVPAFIDSTATVAGSLTYVSDTEGLPVVTAAPVRLHPDDIDVLAARIARYLTGDLPLTGARDLPKRWDTCDTCGRVFSSASSLAQHEQVHTVGLKDKKVFACLQCDCIFKTKAALLQHKKEKHTSA